MADTGPEYKCAICGMALNGARSLSTHVLKKHSMPARTYYDRFIGATGCGICAICGKPTRFRSISEGYKETCSAACRGKLFSRCPDRVQSRNEKARLTNLERYGVENPFQNDAVKQKIARTNMERLGVEYPTQSDAVVAKQQAHNVDKYGATTYLHSEAGRKAVADTNEKLYGNAEFFASDVGKRAVIEGMLAKHGVEHGSQSSEILAKMMQTSRDRNGGILYIQTEEFKKRSELAQKDKYGNWFSVTADGRDKIHSAVEEKYGAEEYFSTSDFRKKTIATNLDRYGVENYAQTAEYHDRVAATNIERYGSAHYAGSPYQQRLIMSRYDEPMRTFGCAVKSFESKARVTYTCGRCGNESTESALFIMWRLGHGYTPCTACLPKNDNISLQEASLGEFIHSIGLSYDHCDHGFLGSQYGAGMIFAEQKVAVEYDGLYWHSELFRDPDYHLTKTRLAEENGYRMVHIFSDEWMYRRHIVESRLKNLLVPGATLAIYARKCDLREVGKAESSAFLEENHIQGDCMDSTRLGLYSSGSLVALMTFGPNRFGEGHELIRYCNLIGTRVVGGAGRLFRHYVDEHPEVSLVTTYADRRWTSGRGAFYDKLGFVYDGESDPGYYYVNGDIRESRMKYQKHMLVADGADASLSEHEIMLARGIYRIYDCGNLRYRWIRK